MTVETAEPVQTLAEYKAERLAPPKAPEAKAEPAKEPGEVVGEATEVKDEADKEPEQKKPNAKLQGRFSELTEQRRQAEQRAEREAERAAAAEKERDELKAKLEPKKAEPDEAPQPKPEDYADAFKFAADLAEWTADRAVKKDRAEREASEAKAKSDAEAAKVKGAWNTRLTAAKKETPDWEDVVTSSEVKVSDPVRDAIIESEHGPQILYLMASEPEIAERLSKLSVVGQVREIGKLEARFDKPEPKAEAKAEETPAPRARPPAPITPAKGTKTADNPSTTAGEFQGTFQEWKAARQRRSA